MSWLSKGMLGWLAVWMVVVPLVHIHPEADHLHGASGHAHGGTVHVAFSPDLPCEYTGGQRPSASPPHGVSSPDHLGLATHLLNHLEFTYSLLPSTPAFPIEQWTDIQDFRVEPGFTPVTVGVPNHIVPLIFNPLQGSDPFIPASRAPPHRVA